MISNDTSVHEHRANDNAVRDTTGNTEQPQPDRDVRIGLPFNPHRDFSGFYAPGIVGSVGRQPDGSRWLTDGQKRLYECLVRLAQRKGFCFPSQGYLARQLGKSDRQIRNDLGRLNEVGLVTHRRSSGRRSHTYRFLWHPIFQDEAAKQPTGVPISGSDQQCSADVTGSGVPTESYAEPQVERERVDLTVTSESPLTQDARLPGEVTPAPADQRPTEPDKVAVVRDALERATGKVSVPSDQLPRTILFEAERLGGNAFVLARWIDDKGDMKRRARDPIFSHGFFSTVLRTDFVPWINRNRNTVEALSRLGYPTGSSHASTPEPVLGACKECYGNGAVITRDGEAYRCRCEAGVSLPDSFFAGSERLNVSGLRASASMRVGLEEVHRARVACG